MEKDMVYFGTFTKLVLKRHSEGVLSDSQLIDYLKAELKEITEL